MNSQKEKKSLLEALRKKAAEILPEGSRLALYGSRARGEAREDSDWDLHILVPGDEDLPPKAYDTYAHPFFELGLYEYGEEVNARVYSIGSWLKQSFLPYYKNVEHDAIILFTN